MHSPQGAMQARVSSEPQAEAQTMASQVAALRERVASEGLPVPSAMPCLDEGDSGATLVRPALERWRDGVAARAVDRLSLHSPDRLARTQASQVLRVDAFRRAGGEGIVLNRALGQSPDDALLLPGQGMSAEYERAKILERHRRGKRHAARAGVVQVRSGAPDGQRSVTKEAGGGQARDALVPDEAQGVRHVFAWGSRDRLTIGEVCRRLPQAGEMPRTGTTLWDRRAVGGMCKNPAYRGTAAFGKTRQDPRRPRLRAQRGRALQPRRAVSTVDGPQEEGGPIPVPALVESAVFAAVQEPWREHQRHARQSPRGALSLLQGFVQCQQCGQASQGQRLSPSARTGTPRAYAQDRCLGPDAYRFGGERIGQHTQGRTDLLALAVWQDVRTFLAHPERLAEAYRRRLHPDTHTQRPAFALVEAQLGQRRQGVARLLDRSADGLLDKHACEPRIVRLRQRLASLDAQRQHWADAAVLHTE